MRTCLRCGNELPNGSHKNRKRCRKCAHAHMLERARARAEESRHSRKSDPDAVRYWREYQCDWAKRRRSTSDGMARMRAADCKWRHENKSGFLVSKAKRRALDLGLPFDLTPADVVVPETCPVLGIRLVNDNTKTSDDSPTLDRFLPSVGYIRGNVCVVSYRANVLKSDATLEEHESVLRYQTVQSKPTSTIQDIGRQMEMVRAARKRARKAGLPCSIAAVDIVIPAVCPILGIRLRFNVGKRENNSPSLDRIDPNLGYIPENIAVISYRANRIKSNGTPEERAKIVAWMREQLAEAA